MDPQRLVQHSVQRGAVIAELLAQLLLLLGVVKEGGRLVNMLLARGWGRRGKKKPRRRASSPQPPYGRPTA
jgi:hypothetical protein